MSLIGDYIADRLKAGEDIPIPTMRVAARLLGGKILLNELVRIKGHACTLWYQWALRHANEILAEPSTPQFVEARRLAELPFD